MIPAVNLYLMPRVILKEASGSTILSNNAHIYEKIVAWVYINAPPLNILPKYAFLVKTVQNILSF